MLADAAGDVLGSGGVEADAPEPWASGLEPPLHATSTNARTQTATGARPAALPAGRRTVHPRTNCAGPARRALSGWLWQGQWGAASGLIPGRTVSDDGHCYLGTAARREATLRRRDCIGAGDMTVLARRSTRPGCPTKLQQGCLHTSGHARPRCAAGPCAGEGDLSGAETGLLAACASAGRTAARPSPVPETVVYGPGPATATSARRGLDLAWGREHRL